MKLNAPIVILVCLFLAGCSLIAPSDNTPIPEETTAVTQTPDQPDGSSQPVNETPTPGPITLLIWLPPQFDPEGDNPGASLLQARLAEFEQLNPGVNVSVRIKAENGPAGLLESLTTTSAAAPLALPDLIALPYRHLQAAALKGLLHPLDELTSSMSDSDWYDYAQELARLQNSVFGLPFAGDVKLLTYRPSSIDTPPQDWESALDSTEPMVFAAADPLALFTLSQYQAIGGAVLDEDGRPNLDQTLLTEVLNFYQQASALEILPLWLTQLQNDEQAWEAFEEVRADMVVTWSTRFLEERSAGTSVAPVITPDGLPYSLATGWAWALAAGSQEHHELSTRLAEHLTEASFLAEWTAAMGYLPPRPSALALWTNNQVKGNLDQISASAHTLPSEDILASLGPVLETATVEVLKRENNPVTAAQEAVDKLSEP